MLCERNVADDDLRPRRITALDKPQSGRFPDVRVRVGYASAAPHRTQRHAPRRAPPRRHVLLPRGDVPHRPGAPAEAAPAQTQQVLLVQRGLCLLPVGRRQAGAAHAGRCSVQYTHLLLGAQCAAAPAPPCTSSSWCCRRRSAACPACFPLCVDGAVPQTEAEVCQKKKERESLLNGEAAYAAHGRAHPCTRHAVAAKRPPQQDQVKALRRKMKLQRKKERKKRIVRTTHPPQTCSSRARGSPRARRPSCCPASQPPPAPGRRARTRATRRLCSTGVPARPRRGYPRTLATHAHALTHTHATEAPGEPPPPRAQEEGARQGAGACRQAGGEAQRRRTRQEAAQEALTARTRRTRPPPRRCPPAARVGRCCGRKENTL